MSSAEIQIAPTLLSEMESRVRGLSTDFGTAVAADFALSAPVDVGYNALMGKWGTARDELDKGLTRIADLLKAIREAFEAADSELSAGLDGQPASPSGCSR